VTVSVTVSDVDRVVVASDGRDRHEVDAGTTVRVGLADRPVRLAGPVADYFEALEKLD
jgi:NAD+ kinase